MNLSINTTNCNHPSFGMAVLFEESGKKLLKQQAILKSNRGCKKMYKKLDDIVARQAENPNNITISGIKNKLVATLSDSNSKSAVNDLKFVQGVFSRNGSLKFLRKAECEANKLAYINEKTNALPEAEEKFSVTI